MIEQPLISVVCPVYNAEKTIKKMIDSVLQQDYQNLQLIIVDDVSIDSTHQIIENRMKTDSRIVLLKNEKNSGPGPSKNRAIREAGGELITFIDGDDWIEKNTLSLMQKQQYETGADVVVCGYYQDFLDGDNRNKYSVTVIPQKIDRGMSTADAFVRLDKSKSFSFCCNKLYRSEIIKNHNIIFPAIMHSEDFFFNINALPFVKSFSVVEKPLYHYIKPMSDTLTSSDYIPDFYPLVNKRYEASRDFCISQNAYKGNTRELLADIHIKHLAMCLIYNCSKKSKMNHKMRIQFARNMLSNQNTKEVIDSSRPTTRASKIMASAFRTGKPYALIIFGRLLWFGKEKMSFLFNKTK